MKKFFDFPTTLMLVFILAAIVAAVLSNPINWAAIIWMFIAGMWVANARSAQMTAESWKDLYETQSKAFKTTKDAWAAAVNERIEADAKYQALDNDYQHLIQEHEATAKENAQLHERVDDLRKQRSDYAEKYQTAAQDLDNANQKVDELTQVLEAKKPAQKTTKKEYTEQDQARIQEELKSAGLKPKGKKRKPAEDED
jgi:chromosome segregation ATPase